ncbi:hypothetical protein OPT61_g7477 [Boeremia exigua]|uniref:Uncharacterized protein n=1 Tax=Boeremia exigua TaxID=749465 RepID=A0ACC2I3E2_9PLEO|nr:hypothetical protein OPT61_g7477 [Boeremia exigua]
MRIEDYITGYVSPAAKQWDIGADVLLYCKPLESQQKKGHYEAAGVGVKTAPSLTIQTCSGNHPKISNTSSISFLFLTTLYLFLVNIVVRPLFFGVSDLKYTDKEHRSSISDTSLDLKWREPRSIKDFVSAHRIASHFQCTIRLEFLVVSQGSPTSYFRRAVAVQKNDDGTTTPYIMRVCTFTAAVIIVILAASNTTGHNILSAPTAAMRLSVSVPVQTSTPPSTKNGIELRQVPGFVAPPAVIEAPVIPAAAPPAPLDQPAALPPAIAPPALDPVVAPAPPPAAAIPPAYQAVSPAPPAAILASPLTTSTMPLPPAVTSDDFVTVQWIETHVGTLRTWVPNTFTFHFEAVSQAPLPGVGSIGMGTLTGKTGQTQTIYMVVGAAPTSAVGAKKVVVAAVAAGVAGLVLSPLPANDQLSAVKERSQPVHIEAETDEIEA